MKKTVLAIIAMMAVIALAASAQTAKPVTGTFTDKRDGKTYRTVKTGEQVWLGENLNYETANSKCYDKDTSYCTKYGRLYNWNDALKTCPAGWHLPTDAEWTTLVDYVGGLSYAGTKLKSKNGWYNNGNGTDDYVFSALPGGFGILTRGGLIRVVSIGDSGFWWSATENDASSAWFRLIDYHFERVDREYGAKTLQFSVRCVRD